MISTRKPDFAEPGQGFSEEEVQRSSLFCEKKTVNILLHWYYSAFFCHFLKNDLQ